MLPSSVKSVTNLSSIEMKKKISKMSFMTRLTSLSDGSSASPKDASNIKVYEELMLNMTFAKFHKTLNVPVSLIMNFEN